MLQLVYAKYDSEFSFSERKIHSCAKKYNLSFEILMKVYDHFVLTFLCYTVTLHSIFLIECSLTDHIDKFVLYLFSSISCFFFSSLFLWMNHHQMRFKENVTITTKNTKPITSSVFESEVSDLSILIYYNDSTMFREGLIILNFSFIYLWDSIELMLLALDFLVKNCDLFINC